MLLRNLHALGRNRPDFGVQINFGLTGTNGLARASRGQDQQLEGFGRYTIQ